MRKKEIFEGIILAAGFSSRMNEWKPEVKIDGRPIIVHAINSMIPFCSKLIIVGGFNYQRLNSLVFGENYFPIADKEKIQVVENRNYKKGMMSSVKAGLIVTGINCSGIFVLPGDMPFVTSETYSILINNFCSEDENDIYIPVTKIKFPFETEERNKKGHPVLIRQRIVNDILKDEDDIIFRDIIKNFNQGFCFVEDKGIIIDIDDRAELEKAKIYYDDFSIQLRGNK